MFLYHILPNIENNYVNHYYYSVDMTNMEKTYGTSKIVLIGDYGSGKTSFMRKLMFDSFEHGHMPTIGASMNGVMLNGNIYTFWDSAGQERYRSLVKLCYRQCHCVFIFYNMNDPPSHHNIVDWIDTLDNFIDASVPVVIIGTKSDMKKATELDYDDESIATAIGKINLIAKITISNKTDSQDEIFKKIKYSLEKASEYSHDHKEKYENTIIAPDNSGYIDSFKKYIDTMTSAYCNIL